MVQNAHETNSERIWIFITLISDLSGSSHKEKGFTQQRQFPQDLANAGEISVGVELLHKQLNKLLNGAVW